MKIILASQLEPGMVIKDGKMLFEVLTVERITDKAIHYTITRIYPDIYGNFSEYKRLNTKVSITQPNNLNFNKIRESEFYAKN